MRYILRISTIVAALLGASIVSGCSANGTDYGPTVEKFAIAVGLVTSAVTDSFNYVEKVHNQSQSDQTALQYALDGIPSTAYTTIFSTEDIKARTAVADGLSAYSEKLLTTVSGKPLDSVSDEVKSAAVGLSRTSMASIDLSHSLATKSSKSIKAAGNNFATLLIEPAQSARIAKLVQKAQSDFHKLTVLLYVDIGSSADQISSCQFDTPSQPENLNLHSVDLCEGGLRSIAQLLYADDMGTLKAHISVLRKDTATDVAEKNALVRKMLSRQADSKTFDAYMAKVQKALILMDDAHVSLKSIFSSKIKPLTTDFDSFSRAAGALSSFAPWSPNLSSISTAATAADKQQTLSGRSNGLSRDSTEDTNEKIRRLRTALSKLDQLLDKDLPLDQLKSTLVARNKLSEQLEAIDLTQIEARTAVLKKTVANLAGIKGSLEKIQKWIKEAKTATSWARATIQAIAAIIAFL